MMGNKKPCIFFQKGTCKKGNNCNYAHVMEDRDYGSQSNIKTASSMEYDSSSNPMVNPSGNHNPNIKQNPSICGFFLKGSCTKQNCRFFHGYSENLQNVQFEQIQEKAIVALSQINEKKFISADENSVQIWMVSEEGHKSMGVQKFENEKINKVIFSNEKVIVATVIEQMLSSKAKVYIITDKGTFQQDSSLKKINDMIEVDSYIFAVGDGNQIDVFFVDLMQGGINRLNSVFNENDKSEMMSIAFSPMRTLFFVGHKSGVISAYMPDPTSILKLAGLSKIHDGSINKIFFKDTLVGNAMQQFVMTCSSDGFLKVFKSDESFENIASKSFDSGVLNIFQTVDYEKTEYFILNLESGDLVVINLGLDEVFKIPSKMASRNRFIVNISNPFQNETEGNFLIVSDGNGINVNMWIKKGAIDNIVQQSGFEGRGGGQSGKGGYRGGYRGGHRGGNQGDHQVHGQGGYQGQGGYKGQGQEGYQGQGQGQGGYQAQGQGGYQGQDYQSKRPYYKRGGGGY